MSVLWLRTAAALYSCGLLYVLIYLFRKSTHLFRPALIAFGAGTVFHLVSIVELWVESGHLPLNNFYETSSFCAFLIALLFLIACTRYPVSIFGVCLFPVVFFMTMIGATEVPVAKWSNLQIRDWWLYLHISAVLIGYAALIFSAVAACFSSRRPQAVKRIARAKTADQVMTLANFIE
jgi:ABC-type transport system involved in cytochrome c biogenesis permease subunit